MVPDDTLDPMGLEIVLDPLEVTGTAWGQCRAMSHEDVLTEPFRIALNFWSAEFIGAIRRDDAPLVVVECFSMPAIF